jgi:two-component system, NarL family, invasion response regulator UvrY
MITQVPHTQGNNAHKVLNPKERQLLAYACTELTYKQIADMMCLSPRTIDGYREALFDKLQVKTRVGLAMYAVKMGLYRPF